jgi:hypothetical protein
MSFDTKCLSPSGDEHQDRAAFVAGRLGMGISMSGAAALLHVLLVRSGCVVGRADLAAALGFTQQSVTTYVSVLRAELDRYSLGDCLETILGRGYRISHSAAAQIGSRLGLETRPDFGRPLPNVPVMRRAIATDRRSAA